MAEIPTEICREIFLRLPAKSLFRFKSVCKSWRHVIEDPSFVKAHTNNKQLSSNTILIRNSTGPPFYPLYSIDLETVNFTDGLQTIDVTPLSFSPDGLSRLSGLENLNQAALSLPACNGLMLVAPSPADDKKTWEIWNPLTHERLELPGRDFNSGMAASGLGYDYATDDYKVVVIDSGRRGRDHGERHVFETHVYSLKSDSWRKIGDSSSDDHHWWDPFSDDGDWWGPNGAGVFLCGALHWIVRDKIIALDIGTEKYREMGRPASEERVRKNLHLLGECLAMSIYRENYYVWVMKDYGAHDSWIKLCSIGNHSVSHALGRHGLRPVAYMKNIMQILLHDQLGFYLFDVLSNSVKMVSIHGLTGNIWAQTFRGGIYQLHDNCGVSKSVATERRIRKRKASKMKKRIADTKLVVCVRKHLHPYISHEKCYSKDSNWCYSSSEDED